MCRRSTLVFNSTNHLALPLLLSHANQNSLRLGSISNGLLQPPGSTNARSVNQSYLFGLGEGGLVLCND